jgi:Cdc6-like AAA superfamily ATPase
VAFFSKIFKGRSKALDDEFPAEEAISQEDAANTTQVRPVAPIPVKQGNNARDNLPRFKMSVTGRGANAPGADASTRARAELRAVFTPAQPVTDRRLFAGRLNVLGQLIEIIEERLSHVVVFGERGIGKTSLLHILSKLAVESRYQVLRGTCGANSSFSETFRTLLSDIPLLYSKNVSPTEQEEVADKSFADLLPAGAFGAPELSEVLDSITGTRVLIILDEYDRLENEGFRQSIAELIKNLSDQASPVQLIIAGVASNLHELVGYIPSIRRNVIGLPMPRLTRDEVQSILSMGETNAGVSFEAGLADLIHMLSNGSPYMVRLLCHHASLIALDAKRMKIERSDIEGALERMVEEAEGRLSYQTAQRARQLDIDKSATLLGLIARAASTPDGWFSKPDLFAATGNSSKTDQAIKLVSGELSKVGLIVEEKGPIESRYKFIDEGLPNYIWTIIAREQFKTKTQEAA